MITVIIEYIIELKFVEEFKLRTIKNAADRRQAMGNVKILFFQESKNKNKFTLMEVFESQKAIDDYYNSVNYNDWHENIKNMIKKKTGADYEILYLD